jgi:hypothetical protein
LYYNNNKTKQHKRKNLGVQKLVVVCCFEFLTHTLGGHNLVISNPFLMIFNALDVPRGEVQQMLGHQKQKNLPLGSGLP